MTQLHYSDPRLFGDAEKIRSKLVDLAVLAGDVLVRPASSSNTGFILWVSSGSEPVQTKDGASDSTPVNSPSSPSSTGHPSLTESETTIQVSDVLGKPIVGVDVVVFRGDKTHVAGKTDSSGAATVPIEATAVYVGYRGLYSDGLQPNYSMPILDRR